jgi:hypothetical protein
VTSKVVLWPAVTLGCPLALRVYLNTPMGSPCKV